MVNLESEGTRSLAARQTTTLEIPTHNYTHTGEEANSLCGVSSAGLFSCNVAVTPASSITSPPDWPRSGGVCVCVGGGSWHLEPPRPQTATGRDAAVAL